MTTRVALLLLTICLISSLINGGSRTEIFSQIESLYLPNDPMGNGPYKSVSYTPDIEIIFNMTLHSRGMHDQNIFRLGQPDLAQYEYPFILIFGTDSWVGDRDVTGIIRAVWDKPGYNGLNGGDIPYITIDSPYWNKIQIGIEYKYYFRLTPYYMYLEINNNQTQYGYSLNQTIEPPDGPYNTSCCLNDIWQIYLGPDNIRESANATISNLYVYAVEPTDAPTNDPTSDPTADPTIDPTMMTDAPSMDPTNDPSYDPSTDPTSDPTEETSSPSYGPTNEPINEPSYSPSIEPTEMEPTNDEIMEPSTNPTPDTSNDANSKHKELFALVCVLLFCNFW